MEDTIASSDCQEEQPKNTDAISGESESSEDASADDTNDPADTSTLSSVSSRLGPIANLCSATLGAGILSLPFGFHQAGLVGGSILLVLSAATVSISIDVLVKATIHYKCKTYEDLVETALGTPARMLTEMCILIFCLGCSTAYLISIGDIVGLLVGVEYRTHAMLLLWGAVCVPLSLLRRMTSLQLASSIGIFSIGLLVVNEVVHYWSGHDHAALQSVLWPPDGPISMLRGCPIFLFAFACQVNVCQIYDELGSTVRPKFRGITGMAIGMCLGLYTSMGVVSLLDFGNATQPNILLNYRPQDSLLTQMAFAGMAVAVICAFPLNIFPARVTLEGFVSKWTVITESDLQEPLLEHDSDTTTANTSLLSHMLLTVALTGSALVFALILPDISFVFGILGGVPSSLLGFCLPGLLGIQMGQRVKGWTLLVGGSIVGMVTTGVTVYFAVD
jgi:amino acid permease